VDIAVGGCRDVVAGHEVFGECFGAFELSCFF
jgi:hypothetical protein